LPIVVRLEGTNAPEARKLLADSGLNFEVAGSLKEAAEKVTAVLNR
ncbi:MAG: succinate--CoA ligase subunit beta, partial [Ignavibacteria bacterium]|nr:succinate--CoA ligase subunit beta [Ignavibacteria bacterium]